MSDWTSLSRREAGVPPDEPYDGVPDHLAEPLAKWAKGLPFAQGRDLEVEAALRLRCSAEQYRDLMAGHSLLDVVDALLTVWARKLGNPMKPGAYGARDAFDDGWLTTGAGDLLRRLQLLLEDGGSVYQVGWTNVSTPYEPFDMWLERRVSEAEAQAAGQAIANGKSSPRPAAGTDLAKAWRAAYGLHPDPSNAYRQSILAVEHAIVPLVEPRNARSTLGTVLGELKGNQSTRWTFDPGTGQPTDLTVLVGLLDALWRKQDDRHGGQPDYANVTQPAAEAAVHLAVPLVRWLTSGALARATTPTSTGTP